ncbi:cytochrome P450 [Aspergillus insuetus]
MELISTFPISERAPGFHYSFYLAAIFVLTIAIAVSRNLSAVRRFITGDALPGIPCLPGLPVVGCMFDFLWSSIPDMVDKLIDIAGRDGVAYFWAGPSIVVQLSDLGLVKDLLSKPDELAARESPSVWTPFATFHRVLGGATPFTYTGRKAREARRHILAAYATPQALSDLFDFALPFADKHVERLGASSNANDDKSLRQYVELYTADLWGELFYGATEGQAEIVKIIPAIDALFEQFSNPASNLKHGIWSLIKHLGYGWTPDYKITRQFQTMLTQRLDSMIATGRLGASYLWKLSPEKHDTNPGEFSDLAVDIARFNIVGGVQGFRQVIPWVILELCRHPDLYQRVHEELKELFPSGEASNISFENFQTRTPCLDAVINEVLRLYPPVHLTARATMQGLTMTTPTGKPFTINPGVIVYFSIYHIHTSEALWGWDAKEFRPERFLKIKESGESLEGRFMPFGYGPRSCPGFKFAPLTIKIYLVLLLRHYHVELHDLGTDITRDAPLLEAAANRFQFSLRSYR